MHAPRCPSSFSVCSKLTIVLGVDVYRYQIVTDWRAVARSGVSFVYVKGTDGAGPAIVRADAQVAGAKSVGLPVGLYHYAQFSPSPETQADVLTREVERLDATGLTPALDLEFPFIGDARARDFARRFLTRLRARGFEYVTLYGNASMLRGINAATLDVPNVRIWLASYGPNDGARHGYSYVGRVDGHQYTSVGRVPGIVGSVDLTWTDSPTAFHLAEEGNVDWSDQLTYEAPGSRFRPSNTPPYFETHTVAETIGDTMFYASDAAKTAARVEVKLDALGNELSNDEANIVAAVRAVPTGGQVDVPALANALVTALIPLLPVGASPEAVADAVREELARHLAGSTTVDE